MQINESCNTVTLILQVYVSKMPRPHAGHQEVSSVAPGFETQGRRDEKSKTEVSVAPHKGTDVPPPKKQDYLKL